MELVHEELRGNTLNVSHMKIPVEKRSFLNSTPFLCQ
jgi:hypothetical protein